MWFLWIFGNNIEGHFRFLLFYLLRAYILKFPRARVKTLLFIFIFITVFNVHAVAFIGIWFFIQLISSVGRAMINVAWFAHIGLPRHFWIESRLIVRFSI